MVIACALQTHRGQKHSQAPLVQHISTDANADIENFFMQVEFFGNHRNMTVSASTMGLRITHRFTGHVDLKENMMGLDTFFHRDFQRELGCLTDPQPGQGCPSKRPDMLVVNSGALCVLRLQSPGVQALTINAFPRAGFKVQRRGQILHAFHWKRLFKATQMLTGGTLVTCVLLVLNGAACRPP